MLPKITHCAIRFNGKIYSLPAPNRHDQVIRHVANLLGISTVTKGHRDNQGFLDAAGNYLTRSEALVNALENGQVKDPGKVQSRSKNPQLYSEDVW